MYEDHRELSQALDIYREFPDDPGASGARRIGAAPNRAERRGFHRHARARGGRNSPLPPRIRWHWHEAYVKEKQLAKAVPLTARVLPLRRKISIADVLRTRAPRRTPIPSAAEQFSAAAKIKPDVAQAWSELAGVLIMAEQPVDGLAALDKVHALGAETSGHFYLRAITLDRLNKTKEALEAYNKFLAASQNVNPDQEFIARQRVKVLEKELGKR